MSLCKKCGEHMYVPDDLENTGLCYECEYQQQEQRIEELEEALRNLLRLEELEMGDLSVLMNDEPEHPVVKAMAILEESGK